MNLPSLRCMQPKPKCIFNAIETVSYRDRVSAQNLQHSSKWRNTLDFASNWTMHEWKKREFCKQSIRTCGECRVCRYAYALLHFVVYIGALLRSGIRKCIYIYTIRYDTLLHYYHDRYINRKEKLHNIINVIVHRLSSVKLTISQVSVRLFYVQIIYLAIEMLYFQRFIYATTKNTWPRCPTICFFFF